MPVRREELLRSVCRSVYEPYLSISYANDYLETRDQRSEKSRREVNSWCLPRFVRNSIFHPASLLPFPVSRSSSRRSRSRCKNSPSPLTLSTIRYYSGIISQCLRAVGARPTTRGGSVATVIKMRASHIAAIGFQCNLLSDAQGLNL